MPATSHPELPSTGLARFHTSSNGSSAPPSRAVPENRTLTQCLVPSVATSITSASTSTISVGRAAPLASISRTISRCSSGVITSASAFASWRSCAACTARNCFLASRANPDASKSAGKSGMRFWSSGGPPNAVGSKRVGGGTCVS